MSFAKSLSVLDELTELTSKEVRAVGFKVLQGVTLKNPKDTGRSASDWLVGIQSPPTERAESSPTDAAGSASYAINNGLSIINAYPKQQLPDLWIVNNQPYIGSLNDGSSLQAPAKFVEQSIAEAVSGR